MSRELTPEGSIKSACADYLRLKHAWFFLVHGHGMQRRGVPDIIGCLDGRLFGIECKVPGNHPTLAQRIELLNIYLAGGIPIVANDVSQVMRALP